MKKLSAVLEDCIMMKDSLTTAGSKILENFSAPFDATVVERLKEAGISITGKAEMNEFGLPPLINGEDASDGKPSGAVRAILEGKADYCLCNDLFGIYRFEAAENNLFYIRPTYGTVPRYGLVPLASSMDQIGVLCRDLTGGFKILSIIAGRDKRDGAMFPDEKYSYGGKSSSEKVTVRIPSDVIELAEFETRKALRDIPVKLSAEAVKTPLDYFDVYKQTLYILACAEISNNISRYDGVKFGSRSLNAEDLETLYVNTRTEAFGLGAKLTAIMGAMVLSGGNYLTYYEKAMRVRRLIKQSVKFEDYDIIALPASIGEPFHHNLSLYALSTLAGLPSVAFAYKGRGVQLIANAKNEALLSEVCEKLLK